MAQSAHSSIQNILSDEKPTVRKSIIIGLGGSGMKGILAAKKYIEMNLPWEAHRYMRWVGVDTTDIETSIEGRGGRYRFPSNQFFQEERRMLYISAPTPAELSIEFLRDKYQNDPAYDWLPNPDVYDISTRAGQGANQTRPLGRIAFFSNEKKIREVLIAERDRLHKLSNDPKYFELMDVQEGAEKKETILSIPLTTEQDRYYFADYLPPGETILSLEASDPVRMLLTPHLHEALSLDHFPHDEKGPYFEVPGERFNGQTFEFRLKHTPRAGQINIFLTASVVGGTGNGMILDMTALIHDIFADFWPKPRIYGIIVLPSAFKRVVNNANARGNAYAALKEIDYFMSGNPFRATYPSGRKVNIDNRLFDDGMLYLLDSDNMAGNSLQGRDQVQELTGQFIATFVATRVGGSIEERMVNDSTRAAIYLPDNESSQRRANYSSFGISRVIYPVPKLREMGFRVIALKLTERFLAPLDNTLLLETIGNLNRGLVRSLRLNAKNIFERMYPDYKADTEVEFRSYREKIKRAFDKRDFSSVVRTLENMVRDYGKEEAERARGALLLRMEKLYRLELDKIRIVLRDATQSFLKDPSKGFHFAETVLQLLLEKLDLYQAKYYKEKTALARYTEKEMEALLVSMDEEVRTGSPANPQKADALIRMNEFNFYQLVMETMLSASEEFTRSFKNEIYKLKNETVTQLKDKVLALIGILKAETEEIRFELLEKKNPLFFYLVNEQEIESFMERYFYSRLSIEDLSNDVDFVSMETEDDAYQMVMSHLISTEGLSVMERNEGELKEYIASRWGDIFTKKPDEVKAILEKEQKDAEGFEMSESSMLRVEVENLRRKLMQIILERFKGFNFENISIKELLEERKIPLNKLLEKLDSFSRPYVRIENRGLRSMEYYRTVTNFELNTYEEGDNPENTNNDLPSRLNHYVRRNEHIPQISVETFVVPNYAKPYEIISIGVLLGIPAFSVLSLEEPAKDYHHLMSEKTHPLHLFNNPSLDARYFPDPYRTTNYINPAKLWEGLVLFKALHQEKDGFVFEEALGKPLREIQAREEYRKKILKYADSLDSFQETVPAEAIADGVNTFAMLARNPGNNKLMFRKEYSFVIRDILDGDGTAEKAKRLGLSKEQYIERHIKAPQFTDMQELYFFLETETRVREFLLENIRQTIKRTRENIQAGADILLPKWMAQKTKLPVFKDKYEFFDYYEKNGSLEWQNLLKEHLKSKVNSTINSSRFRMEKDPTLLDRTKASEFVQSVQERIPDIVAWEVRVANRLLK